MDTKDILILVACLLLAGFSLYKKYVQKSAGKDNKGSGRESGSQFTSGSKDDDYEPYSGSKR